MDRFFTEGNIERYRQILANPRDAAQRRMILKLLAEEMAKLKGEIAAGGSKAAHEATANASRRF